MSYKEHKLPDYFTNGSHLLLDEENVKRANEWVAAAFEKYGNNFDKLIISNDGSGYNKVLGVLDEKQMQLNEFGTYQEALLFAEWVIEKGNVKIKNIGLNGFEE